MNREVGSWSWCGNRSIECDMEWEIEVLVIELVSHE